jgi:heterodisulfide reductase subunit B
MCYHTLKKATLFVKDKEKLEKINLYLEQERDVIGGAKEGYRGEIEVLDFLEFLRDEISYEKIAQKVIFPLRGLKVATYYGCLVLRPPEIAIDTPENPTILENLMEVLGTDIIDNPNRTQCCGSYHTVDRKEIVRKLVYDNLLIPTINGADIIVTCCPLCAFNLDFRQREIKKIHKDFKQIPVVYYTQLMAIAFGLESKTHGFDSNLHLIDPKPIIEAVLENKKVRSEIIH